MKFGSLYFAKLCVAAVVVSSAAVSNSSIANAAEVNVYSARKEALIKPILDRFSEKTGVEINLVTGKADALITRLQNEGEFSPADVLLTTDAGRLVRAKSQGLTQKFKSDVLNAAVPANLRDPDSHWYALTMRARPIMYSPERVNPESISSIYDLAKDEWKGRLCVRSSSNIYNQSMVAAMLELDGEKRVSDWATGLTKAFARPPKGGDRDQIKAVAAGQCDVAIANTYYLAGMSKDGDSASKMAASKVAVLWPDQQTSGVHINISGAALTKHAPNAVQAKQLIEFMASDEAQRWYAEANNEYPVVKGVAWSDILVSYGEFKGQEVSLESVGERNAEALKLMDKAGWK